MPGITRRQLLRRVAFLLLAIAVVLAARPSWHLMSVMWQDVDERQPLPAGIFDDASRLNATKVLQVWPIPKERSAAEEQLARLLSRAVQEGLKVSIAGARHSMGGHTIAPDGIVVDMRPFDALELDAERGILRAQAGATWAQVIPFLDAHGLSVGVLQSDNSFSVGGSISVNCHGWVHDRPPICSTVESLRLMLADGRIQRCARDENVELFALVLGGYGLFGVILDVELRVVPNECYRLEQRVVPIRQIVETFQDMVTGGDQIRMFYGRINVVPGQMFAETIFNVLSFVPGGELPALEPKGLEGFRRAIFRGSVDSDYGKQLRWDAESRLHPLIANDLYSRNQLINEGVELFENRSAATTDILHEYFIPAETLVTFVELAQKIIPRHAGNLLNVTLRSVNEDTDTFLRYADRHLFAFVMLFNQQRNEEADRRMERMSRELIDAAQAAGGRYYLPYRLHASDEQFRAAYPQANEFFAKKREYDPGELFQNKFYLRYGLAHSGSEK